MKVKGIPMSIYSQEERDQMYYLKNHYNKTYRIEQNQDATFEIICNWGRFGKGTISVHNFPLKEINGTNTLQFTLALENCSKNANLIQKKLQSRGVWFSITQTGDFGEFSIIFNEKDIYQLEDILKIRKRKKLTEAQLENLRLNIKKVREASNNA
ncbi:hypothetical protein HN865_01560 [Candidatus Woesearchaeota archaeon]|jgi:hypothetical protein|nr:hypothetical protein [Candidatus Woesearchaeota archaeon]MBT7237524.1 hypothetical protein [Candidatus Woesearchaeota archaeon]